MNDELKERIILEIIKDYKNRSEWTDEYVKEKYSVVIEYMTLNFNRIYKVSQNGAINSKTQGQRSVTYRTGINSIIQSDLTLKALLGAPLLRCY